MINSPILPADRMAAFQPHFFATLNARINALQAGGIDVIRLDEGAPDLPPPPEVIAALQESASQATTHSYQPHRGTRRLREAWVEMYRRLYGLILNPETEVLPLLGSKEGIFHLPLAFVNPGEVVLVPNPGYITYSRGASLAGAETYPLALDPARNYLPDFASIPPPILAKARLMWLNYPNNPTAATATPAFFEEAVAFARQNRILVCHDAAYAQVTFDGKPAPSILQASGAAEVALEFNTLSKSHNMAGWRVGAALGNAALLKPFIALKTNVDSGHFLPILEAAATAMTGDQTWIADRNEIYRQRRDVVISTLHRLGLPAAVPQASLYVWTPIPPGWTAEAFASSLLEHTHVSLTPGTVFGSAGEGYLRISLTAPMERLEQAMQRWMSTSISGSSTSIGGSGTIPGWIPPLTRRQP